MAGALRLRVLKLEMRALGSVFFDRAGVQEKSAERSHQMAAGGFRGWIDV